MRGARKRNDNIELLGHSDPALLFDSMPTGSSPVVELLTIVEVAELLKISVSGVRRLQQQRALPFIKVRGSVRFDKRDIASYLQRNRVNAIGQ